MVSKVTCSRIEQGADLILASPSPTTSIEDNNKMRSRLRAGKEQRAPAKHKHTAMIATTHGRYETQQNDRQKRM
jgi:hypothetical protein